MGKAIVIEHDEFITGKGSAHERGILILPFRFQPIVLVYKPQDGIEVTKIVVKGRSGVIIIECVYSFLFQYVPQAIHFFIYGFFRICQSSILNIVIVASSPTTLERNFFSNISFSKSP